MIKQNFTFRPIFPFTLWTLLLFVLALGVAAQETETYETTRQRAVQLYNENNFAAALPLFEKLAAANPKDVEIIERLGFLVLGNSARIKDPETKKKERIRARNLLLRAQEMGADDALLNSMLPTIPPDGSGGDLDFSNSKEADEAMREGEAAFASGNFEKALAAYERALRADPKLYEAALFTGDVYYKSEKPDKAGEWFARTITIDPDRETAYRYWGDVLMKQGKMDEARAKFVEAFIAEPYNKLARAGLIQWSERNNVSLAHIKIDIPSSISSPEKGGAKVTLDPSMLNDKQDGSAAWLMYALTRVTWMDGKEGKVSEKFAKQYPDEKTYRHSLAEEASALSMVIAALKEMMKDKKVKQLNPSLANLLKLSDAGLIEAYVLLARPDEGIAQDFAAYRKSNHDKLRRYVVEIILTGGGK